MKLLVTLIVVVSVLGVYACTIPETYTYRFFKDKEILEHDEYYGRKNYYCEIVDGDKLVFEYRYNSEDDRFADDDTSQEIVWFEIPPKYQSFSYKNWELVQIKCNFNSVGYTIEWIKVFEGCVQGKRLNELEWQIKIDIIANSETGGQHSIKIDEIFKHELGYL